jgi:hypothetical protein
MRGRVLRWNLSPVRGCGGFAAPRDGRWVRTGAAWTGGKLMTGCSAWTQNGAGDPSYGSPALVRKASFAPPPYSFSAS